MRVFSLADAERAYHQIGLPQLLWEHFEKAIIGLAKETKTTGARSQNNRWNAHLKQVAEEGELGYQKRELEWVVLCEAITRGFPTTKAMLKNGDIIEVPKNPHGVEVTKKEFGILLDVLNEIAYDNGVVLTEYDDNRTRSKNEAAATDLPDSVPDVGEPTQGDGPTSLPHPQHQAEPQEVSVVD
jgi:hypothetical protein